MAKKYRGKNGGLKSFRGAGDLGRELVQHQFVELATIAADAPLKVQMIRDMFRAISPRIIRRSLPLISRLHIAVKIGLRSYSSFREGSRQFDALTDFAEKFSSRLASNLEGLIDDPKLMSDGEIKGHVEDAADKAVFDLSFDAPGKGQVVKPSGNFGQDVWDALGADASSVIGSVINAVGLLESAYSRHGNMDARVLANKIVLSDAGVLRMVAQAYEAGGADLSYEDLLDRIVGVGLTINEDDETAGLQHRIIQAGLRVGSRLTGAAEDLLDHGDEFVANVGLPYLKEVSSLFGVLIPLWVVVYVVTILYTVQTAFQGSLEAMFWWRLTGFVASFGLMVCSLWAIQAHVSVARVAYDGVAFVASSVGSVFGADVARAQADSLQARLEKVTDFPISVVWRVEVFLTLLVFVHGMLLEIFGPSGLAARLIWIFVSLFGIIAAFQLHFIDSSLMKRRWNEKTLTLATRMIYGFSAVVIVSLLLKLSPVEMSSAVGGFLSRQVIAVGSHGIYGFVVVGLFALMGFAVRRLVADDEIVRAILVGFATLALVVLLGWLGFVDGNGNVTAPNAAPAVGGSVTPGGSSVGPAAPSGSSAGGYSGETRLERAQRLNHEALKIYGELSGKAD